MYLARGPLCQSRLVLRDTLEDRIRECLRDGGLLRKLGEARDLQGERGRIGVLDEAFSQVEAGSSPLSFIALVRHFVLMMVRISLRMRWDATSQTLRAEILDT